MHCKQVIFVQNNEISYLKGREKKKKQNKKITMINLMMIKTYSSIANMAKKKIRKKLQREGKLNGLAADFHNMIVFFFFLFLS